MLMMMMMMMMKLKLKMKILSSVKAVVHDVEYARGSIALLSHIVLNLRAFSVFIFIIFIIFIIICINDRALNNDVHVKNPGEIKYKIAKVIFRQMMPIH
jgi:hypothetical protein